MVMASGNKVAIIIGQYGSEQRIGKARIGVPTDVLAKLLLYQKCIKVDIFDIEPASFLSYLQRETLKKRDHAIIISSGTCCIQTETEGQQQ